MEKNKKKPATYWARWNIATENCATSHVFMWQEDSTAFNAQNTRTARYSYMLKIHRRFGPSTQHERQYALMKPSCSCWCSARQSTQAGWRLFLIWGAKCWNRVRYGYVILRSKRVAVGWVFLTCKRCHIFNVTPPTPPLSQTSKMKRKSLHT